MNPFDDPRQDILAALLDRHAQLNAQIAEARNEYTAFCKAPHTASEREMADQATSKTIWRLCQKQDDVVEQAIAANLHEAYMAANPIWPNVALKDG